MARRFVQILGTAFLAVVFAGLSVPVFAQNGTLAGRVVDSEKRTADRNGKPLAGRQSETDFQIGLSEGTVTLELKGEPPRKFQTLTDANGDWYKSGLPPGTYDISVHREWRDPVPGRATKPVIFSATAKGVVLKPGEKLRVPEMGALTEEAIAAGRRPPVAAAPGVSNRDTEAANKRNAELANLFKDTNAALAAGNFADAVAKMTAIADKTEKCGPCYVKIGEIELMRKDNVAAEAAFLKAIEFDPKAPDPYTQLASLYNELRRFDEAAAMGAKGNALLSTTAGGGDATSLFNQGVILWNAGKIEEAQAEFAKSVKMDPKRASAQYWLGMSTYSMASAGKGQLSDAKLPFQEYLKLAPNGEFAETAKALLATIK